MIRYFHYILFATVAMFPFCAQAQAVSFSHEEWKDPGIVTLGQAPARTEFISFDIRENAEKGERSDSPYYLPLELEFQAGLIPMAETTVEIPYMWLDRDVFLHVGGIDPYYIRINGRTVGYSEDSRTPVEYNISRWITDGANTLTFELRPEATGKELENPAFPSPVPDVYIYSQPKIRIDDFRVSAGFDSTRSYCILEAEVILSNSYNAPETCRIGYDLYTPDGGTLIYYDMREITIAGNSTDTVIFEQPLYGKDTKSFWSAENPSLYRFMLNINYDKRWIEYIPFSLALGDTEFAEGTIYRNGKPIEVKAIKYNATDEKSASSDLKTIKKAGYNTICPDYPQPIWFYDLCESTGLYVIEQANINSTFRTDDREVGGAYSNSPQWLGSFLDRTSSMYGRTVNRPCIIGWSLGGEVGNGYNMYKTYLWLKDKNDVRPVIFNDAQGEWNSDMQPLTIAPLGAVLTQSGDTK